MSLFIRRSSQPLFCLFQVTAAQQVAALLLVPLFSLGHVTLWQPALGIPWPVLPAGVADAQHARPYAPAGRAVAEIGPDADHWYYRFAETGAGRHEIKAAPGGALVFEGREDTQFAKKVDHPGFAARPFLRPAIEGRQSDATHAAAAELRRIILDYEETWSRSR